MSDAAGMSPGPPARALTIVLQVASKLTSVWRSVVVCGTNVVLDGNAWGPGRAIF